MNVLITGASGVVGQPLAERCEALGFNVIRSGRTVRSTDGLEWDLNNPPPSSTETVDLALHTAPLWLLAGNILHLSGMGVRRIVCFSSTSILTKASSGVVAERSLVEALRKAESNVRARSTELGIPTTIFRPTMIYGFGRDRNVTAIARFIRKYGFFPVAGNAVGKRQPVHVNDLLNATVTVVEKAETYGKTYNLAGGEVLTYRAMVERIFQGVGRPTRILPVPVRLYKGMLELAALFGKQVNGAMAERMNANLVFDCRKAHDAFDFAPERFLEHPERDLPA